jgi:hypothetical protein
MKPPQDKDEFNLAHYRGGDDNLLIRFVKVALFFTMFSNVSGALNSARGN